MPQTGWIVAGQSLGGLFAALAATRYPDRVSAAVAQSPSLWWPSPPPASSGKAEPGWFEERAEVIARDARPSPILLEAGSLDEIFAVRCRAAAAMLRGEHSLIAYHELLAGHDALQWQCTLADRLAEALRWCGRDELGPTLEA